jgi:hypothetical protein
MRRTAIVSVVLILLGTAVSGAVTVDLTAENEITVTIDNDLGEFTFGSIGGYDYITSPEAVYLPAGGVPGLPMKAYNISIPWDKRAIDVAAVCLKSIVLDGDFYVVPTQPPAVLGERAVEWVEGRPDIYRATRPYPDLLVGGLHQGFMGDAHVLSFHLSPFVWNPETGRLTFCREVKVRIEFEPFAPKHRVRPPADGRRTFREAVARTVVNPSDLARFGPPAARRPLLGASMLDEGAFEYVVIAVDSMAAAYQPLVDWKTRKGIPATVVTREWIYATYTGEYVQEQIRNFIKDAYQTWGTVWVLLGGDTDLVPSRSCFAMDCEIGGPPGNVIRADLYYSDLDGTWNDNGETPFGEVEDNVDMYPDVFVGRAPARSVADAQVFVDKVLTYEKNPPADYALKMLMPGEVLWLDPFTDAGEGLNRIDEDFIPPRFDPILKLYETLGNETVESVLAAMSAGQNFVLHDGHCSEDVMGAGNGYIYLTDTDTLSNWPRNFILNSIGCWPAAIDRDCIAEHLMNNPDGGCVAFIGNCRYGWGSPGNPGFGYSDKFQHEWARWVFANNVLPLGASLAEHKIAFVSFAGDENVYRWNEYQINLLGDPEMPAWTDEPAPLEVAVSPAVLKDGDEATVVVEDSGGLVEGALVCLMNGVDLYEKGLTDETGTIRFGVSTSSPDSLHLTVTAPNHAHRAIEVPVETEGVVLAWTDVAVLDGGDARVNPGEIADIAVRIKNFGTEPDSGVWGVLRAGDAPCSVVDSVLYYGNVPAGSEVDCLSPARVELDSALVCGRSIVLELVLGDSASGAWSGRIPLVVATPIFSVTSYGVNDLATGDGDFVADPGENVLLTLEVYNSGLTYDGAAVTVQSLDPYVAVSDSVTDLGVIRAASASYSLHDVQVAPGCPETHVARLLATVETAGSGVFQDTVYFDVGDLSFTDDCEGGDASWTYGGLWHLTSYRSHSDSMSWYFGNDVTHTYPSNASGDLVSRDFIAGEANRLSFWFRHEFTTYGVDGVHVVMLLNGVPDTLDFIGSGGALDGLDNAPLGIVTDWVKWDRALEGVAPGDTVAFKFGFSSDNTDVAEGMYIDDIGFTCKSPVHSGVGNEDLSRGPIDLRLSPNPVRNAVTMYLGDSKAASITVYGIDGRLVVRLERPAGRASVAWDLKDASGRRVAPGIYVARTMGGGLSRSAKLVVLE